MGKLTKGLDYDSAKEKLVEVKSELKEARLALQAFLKENKLKRGEDHSEDKKHGKKFTSMTKKIETLSASRDELDAFVKENKPSKTRSFKYPYSNDLTTGLERKHFRTQMRAKAKRAGVSVEEYLSDTDKYNKLIDEKKASKKKPKAEKSEKKASKAEKAEKPEKKKIKKKVKSED